MKNMMRVLSVILCFAVLLTLCGCGRDTKETEKEPISEKKEAVSEKKEDNASDNDSDNDEKERTCTLSEYLRTGQTIWYQIAEYEGKDSEVKKILVLEPDGSMYVAGKVKYTLGELEQMKDGDIVQIVKEIYAKEVAADMTTFALDNPDQVAEHVYLNVFSPAVVCEIVYGGMEREQALEMLVNAGELSATCLPAVEREWASIQPVYNAFARVADHPIMEWYGSIECVAAGLLDMALEGAEELNGAEYLMMDFGFNEMGDIGDVETLERDIAEAERLMEIAVNNVTNAVMADFEYNQGEVEPARYRLTLQSDETGNHTYAMILAYVVDTPNGQFDHTIYLYYDTPVKNEDGALTNCRYEVYDSLYGGYLYGQKDGVFFTRGQDGLHFVLDEIGKSGLPVDVTDIEALFG